MSARKTIPIGIIVMLLVMALAALGVGYAWWTEQLTATGSIQTGSIDVKMQNINVSEDDPLNAATCDFTISGDGKSLTITIANAYPAYVCNLGFDLNNLGTVPAKITGVTLPAPRAGFSVTPSGELNLREGLDPSIPKHAEFNITVLPGAKQSKIYTFDVSVDIAQANAP